jgi:hypothetical protein
MMLLDYFMGSVSQNGVNNAIAALANKDARMARAPVKTGEAYKVV